MKVVHTLGEFKAVVDESKHRIVVVRFYATWCKACSAVAPSFYKFAKKYENAATFVDVPATYENASLHQGLEIPSLPYGQIYWDGVLVEEQRILRKLFPKFESLVNTYIHGQSTLPDDGDCSNPYVDEEEVDNGHTA
eukprot:CAMPEP_0195541432 /NCGR_PEP_ID=MMETSP0794_2-20130614/51085_1 /TAXON_ID=515487 /ORGANISM="Stephanopyxis turris, Strain CCMP 815" /LENGTH=136 /DNA_ID=CAMNT_0040675531 /DNA_START=438 /DNA_END=848 /DNA_ORIENTATION=+